MHVRVAVLADYASLSTGDKLNVLGIFSNLMAREEPIVHPQMHLVVQFEFDPAEEGRKDLATVLQDEDGQTLLTVQGELLVGRTPRGMPTLVNHIVVLNGLRLPHFGNYVFRIVLNGRTEAEVPLFVTRVAPPTAKQGNGAI